MGTDGGKRHMGAGKKRALTFPFVVVIFTGAMTGCMGSDEVGGGAATIIPFVSLFDGADVRTVPEEGNDSFEAASFFPLVIDEPQAVKARIDPSTDIDVYELGEVVRGDRLVVEVTGAAGLDAAVAVFDADGNLMYLNDDRNYFAGQMDPLIDFVVRRDGTTCYAAVAASPGSRGSGDYTLAAAVLPGTEVPPPRSQTVVLNFDGADSVTFGGRSPVSIPRFDAGNVSVDLGGQTEELIELIVEHVRDDFAGLNVEIFTSREGGNLGAEVTTIHFGAYDRALLGVAENIDEFNERTIQEGIIFTDTFAVFNVLEPTLEQYAQAFANVASHEIGHLLGLVHTADVQEIMDITASLRRLMRDQTFGHAPLENMTFPLGFQDASVTLFESVGGDLEAFRVHSAGWRAAAAAEVKFEPKRFDAVDDPPRPVFSRCMCRECEVSRLKRHSTLFPKM